MISMWKMREYLDKATNIVMNYTEMEAKVREATNDEPWGPSGKLMGEIAKATFMYELFPEVMNMLWARMLRENKNNWRRAYKGLLLLTYLLRNGSERVVTSAREHLYDLRSLEDYHFVDENGKDQGVNVRQKVKEMIEFVQDDERVREERKKAKKHRDKYIGVSSDTRFGYNDRYDSEPKMRYDDDWERPKPPTNDEEESSDKPRRKQKEYRDSDSEEDHKPRRNSSSSKNAYEDDEADFGASSSAAAAKAAAENSAAGKKRPAVPSKMVDLGAATQYKGADKKGGVPAPVKTQATPTPLAAVAAASAPAVATTTIATTSKSTGDIADLLFDPGFSGTAPTHSASGTDLFADFTAFQEAGPPTMAPSFPQSQAAIGSANSGFEGGWNAFGQGPNAAAAAALSGGSDDLLGNASMQHVATNHGGAGLDLFGEMPGPSIPLSGTNPNLFSGLQQPQQNFAFPGAVGTFGVNPQQGMQFMQPMSGMKPMANMNAGGLDNRAKNSTWSDSGGVNISLEGLSPYAQPSKAPQLSINALMQQQAMQQPPMNSLNQGFGNMSLGGTPAPAAPKPQGMQFPGAPGPSPWMQPAAGMMSPPHLQQQQHFGVPAPVMQQQQPPPQGMVGMNMSAAPMMRAGMPGGAPGSMPKTDAFSGFANFSK
ncbi:clathrin interactor 1 isoform X1 [Lampetra fluviatilis]